MYYDEEWRNAGCPKIWPPIEENKMFDKWNEINCREDIPDSYRMLVGNSKTKRIEIRYWAAEQDGFLNHDSEDYEPYDWYDRWTHLPESTL